MPTAKKEASVLALKARLLESKNLFFTNYAGLTVAEISKLRRQLRADGSTYSVVKNTLFSIAADAELARLVKEHLAGPTGVVFAGDDPVAPAKALKTFSDDTKRITIKAAYIDGELVGPAQVAVLAALPPKIELIAKMIGSLASPLRGLLNVLSGNQGGLVRVLNALREKKLADSES